MKKTLIALAALAATGAFAQSAVTLSGTIDVAYALVGGDTQDQFKAATVTSMAGIATSSINFEAIEDLGGGMKGGFRMEMDPRAAGVDGGAIGQHQFYVNLDGGFGSIKLGRPNSPSYSAFAAASVFGTATGSGYGYTNANVGMTTRYNRSVMYTTPNFGGLTASLLYVPGNDNSTTLTAYAGQPYQRSMYDLGIAYSNGPLNIAFAALQAASQTNAATVAPTSAANQASSNFYTVGANYNFGVATGYLGFNQGKTLGTTASTSGLVGIDATTAGLETRGSRVAVKFPVNASTTLNAGYAAQDVETAVGSGSMTNRKVWGLNLVKDLSKRTAVYAAYESYTTGVDNNNDTTAVSKGTITTTAVGIRHNF